MRLTANVVLGAVVLFLATEGCVRRGPTKHDEVLASIGQKEIRESDFRAEFERLDPSLRTKYRKDPMALLNKMIEEELVYQHAVEKKLAETTEGRKRLARAEQDTAIERFKEREIYAKVAVTDGEIKERYRVEVGRPGGSSLVRSLLYVCTLPDDPARAREVLEILERGVNEGLSFPEVARRNSLDCESFEVDSATFADSFPPQIRSMAARMTNRTGVTINLGGAPFYFFKDAEPLSSCFRGIRGAIRKEKGEKALGDWLSSRRASSAIRLYEEALDDMTNSDGIAAEVNGVALTVGDAAELLEGLSEEEKSRIMAHKEALLGQVADRELLRQEAYRKNLLDENVARERVARETRRVLTSLAIEQNVAGYTAAAREKSRAEWVEELKKATGVKVFAENVKKMYIPASKEIEEIFGSEAL